MKIKWHLSNLPSAVSFAVLALISFLPAYCSRTSFIKCEYLPRVFHSLGRFYLYSKCILKKNILNVWLLLYETCWYISLSVCKAVVPKVGRKTTNQTKTCTVRKSWTAGTWWKKTPFLTNKSVGISLQLKNFALSWCCLLS